MAFLHAILMKLPVVIGSIIPSLLYVSTHVIPLRLRTVRGVSLTAKKGRERGMEGGALAWVAEHS